MGEPGGGVLYVIHHHRYSGAETLHIPIMQADPDPLLACPPDSDTSGLAESAGIPTVGLPFYEMRHSGGAVELVRSVFRGVRAARALRKVIKAHPSRRTIYCIALRPGMMAALAGLGLRRHLVWYVPDCLPPRGVARLMVKALAWWRADQVIAISEFVMRDAGGEAGRLARRMRVVEPGVDIERFAHVSPDPGRPLAAVVGHVSPTKRTDVAIDAAKRLVATRPGFSLKIVGRAMYRDEDFEFERRLKHRVQDDPDLRGTVTFDGFSGDVASSLDGAGLLLHCREEEPFGMVLLEAMACGLPVVAPRAGGPLEIVEDGVTGLLYPAGDAAAAAVAVEALLDDPDLALEMGAAGRRRVHERFDARERTKALAAVIHGGIRS